MNREHAKELLPVFTAFAEGQDIEVRPKWSDSWRDMSTPVWTYQCDYRIKPDKPREWEVLVDEAGWSLTIRQSGEGERNWIKVREVLE